MVEGQIKVRVRTDSTNIEDRSKIESVENYFISALDLKVIHYEVLLDFQMWQSYMRVIQNLDVPGIRSYEREI
jgi:hypothetical protein